MNEGNIPHTKRVVLAISPERRDRDGRVTAKEGEGFWKEVGAAFTNADNSINVYLDAIPVSGKLQIRDIKKREDGAPLASAGGMR